MIRVSVVVPCREDDSTLLACLEALERQTLPRSQFEVLLVDGGDETVCGVLGRRFGARMLRDDRRGPGAARNVGIAAARGEVVAFTDADCVPADDWLECLLEVLAEDPRRVGVAGDLRMPRTTLIGRLEDMEAQAFYRGYITSNVAYRREALADVGGFDERLSCAEDSDLAWRIVDRGGIVIHDPRPKVLHQPPEVSGSLREYLAKQLWYARNDVPAHTLALARARAEPSPGSVSAVNDVRGALANTALSAAALSAPFAHRLGGASLAALAGKSAARVASAARATGRSLTMRDGIAMTGIVAARRMARGWGTMVGFADLLRPSVRDRLFREREPTGTPSPTLAAPGASPTSPAAPSPRASAA